MLTERQSLFLQHVGQTSPFPLLLEVEKAEGIYMYGPQGKRYIDLISGIGVSNVGHRHPRVVEAVKQQVDKYMHLMVYGEFVQAPQVQLAQALAQSMPAPLEAAYLVNSGSEAIEGSLKLAKRYTGRSKLIAFSNAYHGSTHGALSIGGGEEFKQNYRPLLPGITHLPHGHLPALEQIDSQTAAVVLETVQGEAGVRVPTTEYMQALRKQCTDMGALLILDEIQCGAGRTGTLWAFEQFGIVPDIVTTAKGLGGGMPIGAFVSSHEIMGVLQQNPILGHITTFGGHPVSAAAAAATLQVIQEEKLTQEVPAKARLFNELLQHPAISEIRQCGLLMAVELGSFERLKPVIDKAIELGAVTDWFLFCDSAMRIAPPLTISTEEIKQACAIVLQAINEVLPNG